MEDKKISKIVLPLFIIGIMVFSVLGYAIVGFSGDDSEGSNQFKETFRGHEFTFNGNLWVADINGKRVEILNKPSDLESIYVDPFIIPKINGASKVYISRNPLDNTEREAQFLRSILLDSFNRPINMACLEDGLGCENLPLKACKDSESSNLVLQLIGGNIGSINIEGECISFVGDNLQLVQLIERVRLELLL